MWLIEPRPSTLGRPSESTDVAHGHARPRRIRSTSLRSAPAWRWERHFWGFRPNWGLDSGGTTPAAGLLEVGASVPVLGCAAPSARILTWVGRSAQDRVSRACPGPEVPHETQDMPLAAARAGSSPPEAFAAAVRVRAARPRWRAADGRLAYGNVTRIRGGRGSGLRKTVSDRAGRCGGRRTRGLDVARPYCQAAAREIYSPERAAVFNCPVRISRPPNLPR